jgi:hypothetical protein
VAGFTLLLQLYAGQVIIEYIFEHLDPGIFALFRLKKDACCQI